MMQLPVAPYVSYPASTLSVSEAVFACDFNEPLVHQVVVAYMAYGRQGSKAQKNRGEVRGGGKKPWKQKGTGRARVGSIRSPLWRTGGVTFAAVPRDYSQKVNKRMYRKAMHAILSELNRQGRLTIVQNLAMSEIKTKVLLAQLKELGVTGGLLVVDEMDTHLQLSARNIPHLTVMTATDVNPVILVGSETVVMTVDAIKRIEERLA